MNARSIAVIMSVIAACVFLLPHVADAVTVGPVKLEYTVDPGTSLEGEFFLKNEELETKTFYPLIEKFNEVDGNKVFSQDTSTLAVWLDTAPSVTLAPNQDIRVPFTISVPRNAPPGGHFAVVWWSTTPPVIEGGQQVAVVTRAGILVYLNVNGEVTGSASIADLGLGKSVFWSIPDAIPVTANIKNDMNIYIKPQGDITLTSIFGSTKASVPLNAKGLQVLPQSEKGIPEISLDTPGLLFGPYKLNAAMEYGENDSKGTIEASRWVFFLPIHIIIIALLLIFGVPALLKRYNKWVINQARQGGRM
jgi:hypothetical protein